jgi:hypothetical protein
LIDTEGGWGFENIDQISGINGMTFPVPLDTAYVARWYLLQAGLAATKTLKVASWYFWDPTCSQNCTTQDWGALGYLNAAGSLIPFGVAGDKTSYGSGLAVGWLSKWLVGSTLSPCSEEVSNPQVWSCSLTLANNGGSAKIVWFAPDNATPPTWDTRPYAFYQDLTGCVRSTGVSKSITLAQQPVILIQGQTPPWGYVCAQ